MYGLLALFAGAISSIMVAFNGELTAVYGTYTATALIHVAGLILICAIVLIKREKPFAVCAKRIYYVGGFLGVLTTAFTNLTYGGISVSAILAIGLFGQCVFGLIFDQWGVLGMPVRRFYKNKLIGLVLILAGICCMLDSFKFLPMLLTFTSGAILVLSRTLNSRLAESTSVHVSTFFNYVTGLAGAVLCVCLFGRGEPAFGGVAIDPRPFIYCGGLIGVVVVGISNLIVRKISAFYMTLFQFVGQVFMGVAIDAVIDGSFSVDYLIGGFLVAAGLAVNLVFDRRNAAREG